MSETIVELERRENPPVVHLVRPHDKPFTLRRVSRYRLYPTKRQERELLRQLELCRRLYNKGLWWRQGVWERERRSVNRKQQQHALVDLKVRHPEYASICSGVLEDVVNRVAFAYQGFFGRVRAKRTVAGYPRPKGPGQYKSFTVPRAKGFRFRWDGVGRFGRLSFKGFSGIRVRMHRPLPGSATVRRAIVKREATGQWYVVFGWDVVDYEPPAREPGKESVGLHPGLVHYLSTDDGEQIAPDRTFARHRRKLGERQRRLSRGRKGSKRRAAKRELVAKQNQKIRDARRDFQQKLSRDLVDRHDGIFINRFEVSGMLSDNELKNLNGRIGDAAWIKLGRMLRYKAESAGVVYAEVDAELVAQVCSICDKLVPKDLSVRIHHCPHCGYEAPRGVNAAGNAKRRAVQALRGGVRSTGS